MTVPEQIIKQKQCIVRCEKSLTLEKIKKRRADTRHKIQLGGLVIKSGMDGFNKTVILGALDYTMQLIKSDSNYLDIFGKRGDLEFLK